MKSKSAPIEFFRTTVKYPIHIHIFEEDAIVDSSVIPRHWHENIELTYRIRYKGLLYINGKKYPLNDNSLFIINSSDIHEIHTFPQQNMYAILISISYDFMRDLIPDINTYHFKVGKHEKQLKETVLEMRDVYERSEPNSHIHLVGLTYKLVYYMLEDSIQLQHFSNPVSTLKNDTKKHEILNYIKNNITEIHSVQELSTHFGYSREHFGRIVSTLFGITCQTLLMETRLSAAISLMENTTFSLDIIAEKSGFPSSRTFIENFRKYYGQHPRDYQRSSK